MRQVRGLVLLLVLAAVGGTAAPADAAGAGPARAGTWKVAGPVASAQTYTLPVTTTHVAVHWSGRPSARVRMAMARRNGFGPLRPVLHDEVGHAARPGETFGALVATRGVRRVRVVTDRPLARLTIVAFTQRGAAAPRARAAAVAGVADTQPGPEVVSRAGWGADESLRFDASGAEIWPPAFWPIQKLIVHHTATTNDDPDPAATVRAIYRYHAVEQGWGDVGYNFLIDEAGHVYEGRHAGASPVGTTPTGQDADGDGVTAAHAYGYNAGTVGIALLGTLTNRDATPAARAALEALLAWLAAPRGIDPGGSSTYTNPVTGSRATFPNIAGHRDVGSTECPGDAFHATLPALRTAVAARLSGTSDFTVAVSPASRTVRRGGTTTYAATVSPSGGFADTVALSVTGVPPGVSASLTATSLPGSGSSTLTVRVGPKALRGTSTLTLVGAAATRTRTATATLTIR
jgi:hypothetical protein